jgi:hypothetical protein
MEDDAREMVKMYFASSLDGHDKILTLLLLHGEKGGNGKSTFLEIHANALGQYATKVPSSILIGTKRQESGSANAAIEELFGKRMVYSTENAKGERFDPSRFKELFSGEKVSNRALYKQQHADYLQCRYVHSTNFLPLLPETIYAMYRRLYKLTLKYTFKKESELTPGAVYEKVADRRFMTTIKNDPVFLTKYLSYLTFNCYAKYASEYNCDIDNVKSQTILHETEEYISEQDTYFRFLRSRVVVSPRHKQYTIDQIAEYYTKWHFNTISKIAPKKEDVVTTLQHSKLDTHLLQYHRILEEGERFKGDDEGAFGDEEMYKIIKANSIATGSMPEPMNTAAKTVMMSPAAKLSMMEQKHGIDMKVDFDLSDVMNASIINP